MSGIYSFERIMQTHKVMCGGVEIGAIEVIRNSTRHRTRISATFEVFFYEDKHVGHYDAVVREFLAQRGTRG